jgi:hyperosmotically inducible protein
MRTRLSAIVLFVSLAAPRLAAAQMTDMQLAERVADVVRHYAHFSIYDDVSITVSDRNVTLNGRVTMPFKRDEILAKVGKIDGVRSLTNAIGVLPVSGYDDDLRERIARAIYGNSSFRKYASMVCPPIHIIVEGGQVTLTGVVNDETERVLAYSLAHVPGVFGVMNQLKLDGRN